MNNDTSVPSRLIEAADEAPYEELLGPSGGPDLISDDDIDYADIARRTQPGQPGGEIVFDSDDYATHEEAMAALEAFLLDDSMDFDDEATSAT